LLEPLRFAMESTGAALALVEADLEDVARVVAHDQVA